MQTMAWKPSLAKRKVQQTQLNGGTIKADAQDLEVSNLTL